MLEAIKQLETLLLDLRAELTKRAHAELVVRWYLVARTDNALALISTIQSLTNTDDKKPDKWPDECHPSHVTRVSVDASSYDEICVNCGATDNVIGGWGELRKPCPVASLVGK